MGIGRGGMCGRRCGGHDMGEAACAVGTAQGEVGTHAVDIAWGEAAHMGTRAVGMAWGEVVRTWGIGSSQEAAVWAHPRGTCRRATRGWAGDAAACTRGTESSRETTGGCRRG